MALFSLILFSVLALIPNYLQTMNSMPMTAKSAVVGSTNANLSNDSRYKKSHDCRWAVLETLIRSPVNRTLIAQKSSILRHIARFSNVASTMFLSCHNINACSGHVNIEVGKQSQSPFNTVPLTKA